MPQLPGLQLMSAQTAYKITFSGWQIQQRFHDLSRARGSLVGNIYPLVGLPSKTLLDEQEFFLRIFVFVDFRFVKSTQIPEGD